MRKTKKNRFIFPLQDLHPFCRSIIALSPLFLLILLKPWLPDFALGTPIIFHYPLLLLAIWLGGSVPGILGNLISSVYIFGYLKPELWETFAHDPAMKMRAIAFYSSTLSFLFIVYLFERALKKAEDAVQQRDEFLSMISHELRTPLTAIKLNLAVLKDQLKEDAKKFDRSLSSIERSTNRQDKLISAMLDLAMLETGHLGIRKEECHLNDIVAKAVETASESLHFENVEMRLIPLVVKCDKLRVEQVIFNLVHNAIKYGDNSKVVVTLEANNDKVFVKIQNNGTQIAESARPYIFKKFARPVQTTQVQGLGLGLYLSRHLVELHEGKLELTSSDKAGTTFTIVLPAL